MTMIMSYSKLERQQPPHLHVPREAQGQMCNAKSAAGAKDL